MGRRKRDEATKNLFAYADDNLKETIVYIAVNKFNGHRYVGLTRLTLEKRRQRHISHAAHGRDQHFYRAIRKYGADAFEFSEIARCPTYKEACQEERRQIASINPEYNKTAGGEGIIGHRHNAETRKKMSVAKQGKGPWGKGQCPDYVREKLSQTAKMRRGREVIDGARREAMVRNAKKANEGRRRGVVCLTDGKSYISTTEAAAAYSITTGTVANICSGKFKSRSGLALAYAEVAA